MTVGELRDILENFNDSLEVYIQIYDWERECDGYIMSLDGLDIKENDRKVVIHL